MFWANIGLIGGSTQFPNFRMRLYVLLALLYADTAIASFQNAGAQTASTRSGRGEGVPVSRVGIPSCMSAYSNTDSLACDTRRPLTEAYRGAVAFASRGDFPSMLVTREEYNEMGSNACLRKFRGWKAIEEEETTTMKGKAKAREEVEDDDRMPSRRIARGRGRGATTTSTAPKRRGRGGTS